MADPEGVAEEQRHDVEMRRFSFYPMDSGRVMISGELDSLGAATLRTALEPLARPSGAEDHRRYDPSSRRRPGRAGHLRPRLQRPPEPGQPAPAPPGHDHPRHPPRARRLGRRRGRSLAADLRQDRPATGLRLQRDPGPPGRRLSGHRRRPRPPGRLRAHSPCSRPARQTLSVAGLRPASSLVGGSPLRPLDGERPDRSGQPHPLMWTASLDGPRGRLGAGLGRGRRGPRLPRAASRLALGPLTRVRRRLTGGGLRLTGRPKPVDAGYVDELRGSQVMQHRMLLEFADDVEHLLA
jgi:hypothetical protein